MPICFHATDWMGEFTKEYDKKYGPDASRSFRITNLCIPGTHDSGTAFLKKNLTEEVVNAVRCQELTIEEQLDHGIRYLDIRVKYEGNSFCIVHDGPFGPLDYVCVRKNNPQVYLTLPAVLDTCRDFLAEHTGEFLIVSIKIANSSREYSNALGAYLMQNYGQLFVNPDLYMRTDGPQGYPGMQDARGKIILLRRFVTDQKLGYDYTRWGSVDPDSDGCFYLPSDGVRDSYAMIQDMFHASLVSRIEGNVEQKVKYYVDCLRRYHMESIHSELAPPLLFINFLSCTKCGFIKKLADQINDRIVNYFCDQEPHPIPRGVTVMDFPTEDIINLIIGANFTLTK